MTNPSVFTIRRVSNNAASYLRRLPEKIQRTIAEAFNDICQSPFSHPSPTVIRPLKGPHQGRWRYRLGDLRIIYTVDVQEKAIEIIAIGPRGDIY